MASSTHMSVMPVMDFIFSLSSIPLNSRMDPFGKPMVNVLLFILQYCSRPMPDSTSSTNCHTESLIVAPTFLMIKTLRS